MANFGGETSVASSHVWLTPPHILKALGDFDLDPCASDSRPWDTARNHYTKDDDGLASPWFGRVWMNPPYGPPMGQWLRKLSEHSGGGWHLSLQEPRPGCFLTMFGIGLMRSYF